MGTSRRAAVAAWRFGLGARPGELEEAASDPEGWLLDQLRAPDAGPSGMSAGDAVAHFGRATTDGMEDKAARKERRQAARAHFKQESAARVRHRVETPTPFRERLVAFWSNHFTVSVRRPALFPLAVAHEREAIRPHVAGRFSDLLLAAVRHPAMLIYLDNPRSIGPRSRLGQRREGAGLNENLAREVLELHTLGADGGYSQDDVVALARILTGWSVDRRGDGGFVFRERAHEPGAQRLLGRRYRQPGVEQGEAALRALARHPSTAQHICHKLAAHFVSDAPPPRVVDALTEVFRDTDGDLAAVSRALVERPEAWSDVGSKVRSPEDWLTAAARALALDQQPEKRDGKDLGERLLGLHARLGQAPFSAPSPAGWPDHAAAWAGSEALLERIDVAGRLGRRLSRVHRDAAAHAESVLGPLLDGRTAKALRRAPDRGEALALLLLSPAVVRR